MRHFLEIVYITWIDTETQIGWEEMKDALKPFEENRSIGFLVAQDLDMYVIAADYDHENDHFNRVMRIPRPYVKRLRTVTIVPLPRSGA